MTEITKIAIGAPLRGVTEVTISFLTEDPQPLVDRLQADMESFFMDGLVAGFAINEAGAEDEAEDEKPKRRGGKKADAKEDKPKSSSGRGRGRGKKSEDEDEGEAKDEPKRSRRSASKAKDEAKKIKDRDLVKAAAASAEIITVDVVKEILDKDFDVDDVADIPDDRRQEFLDALTDEENAPEPE